MFIEILHRRVTAAIWRSNIDMPAGMKTVLQVATPKFHFSRCASIASHERFIQFKTIIILQCQSLI
jgi:hypothetical protein